MINDVKMITNGKETMVIDEKENDGLVSAIPSGNGSADMRGVTVGERVLTALTTKARWAP